MSIIHDTRTQILYCLGAANVLITEAQPFETGSGCDVIDCKFVANNTHVNCGVLKIYRNDFDDYSGIGVMKTARKFILTASEFNVGDINIPTILGYHLSNETSSVLTEKLDGVEWSVQTRVTAAEILGHLHRISLYKLSNELQEIISESRPNKSRVRNGVIQFSKYLDNNYPIWRKEYPQFSEEAKEIIENVEPKSSMRTLVHGDYFSKNIIPTKDGIYIVDWDLLAMGDPMWDLGFLLGADPNIGKEESEAIEAAYLRKCEIDENILSWHRKCWRLFWELRNITNK